MQIVLTSDNTILATHSDEQDLRGKYPGLRVLTVAGFWEAGQQLTPEEAEFPTETAAATNRATIESLAEQALIDLRTLANTTGNLSSANLSNGLRLVARTQIRTIRLLLKKLEGTD